MAQTARALRWQTVPRNALIWRELDGELVVRNERSGSTHLLEPPASELLRLLIEADAAVSLADLAARLREEEPALEAILSEFQRLGLAEPA